MSEDTWKLVDERRARTAKQEAAKTRKLKLAATNMYNKKNHEIKRSCRTDKRRKIKKKYTRSRGSSRAKGYEEGLTLQNC